MALVPCRECGERISDQAWACPKCGAPTGVASPQGPGPGMRGHSGYEYKSEAEMFGLPLIHIATGLDPKTGKKRVAKGIIAIGDVAIGGVAVGGVAMGGLALGGMSVAVLLFWATITQFQLSRILHVPIGKTSNHRRLDTVILHHQHHHFRAIIHCFVNLPQPTSTQDLLGCYCSNCELVSSSLDTPVER